MKSAIGKTPGPLGTDHSPMFVRFSSPIAHPNDGSLPTVYSPPPAAPSRWGLDETGAQTYHDLLLRWSHDELLTELSTSRHTFVQARTGLFPLAQAASALELNHTHDGEQIHEAPRNHRPWIHGKLTDMRIWRNTLATPRLFCSHLGRRIKPGPSRRNGCITSHRCYTGYLCHTGHAGIDSLSCGVNGRIRRCRFGSQTSLRLRFWTPSGV